MRYPQGGEQADMRLIFEWDINKARTNLTKHRVSFEEAKTLFNDPLLVTFLDERHSDTEERLIGIGVSARNRTLLVVHVDRKETPDELTIRIISCRKATQSERKTYEENI
jgi:uncharacterized DUF497 family protein